MVPREATAAQGRITTLQYALLGLLVLEPRTGYAVRRVFETTPMSHYGGGQGSIYPALRVMEQRGLVSGRETESRPGRGARVLRATVKGRSAFVAWLRTNVTQDDVATRSEELMLRFAFMDGLFTAEEVRAFLNQYRAAMESELERLQAYARTEAAEFPTCARLAVQHGLLVQAANLEWARRAGRVLARASKSASRRS